MVTIGLAAAEGPFAVVIGSGIGISLCVGIAVLGANQVTKFIDERTIGLFSGALFLAFGTNSAYEIYKHMQMEQS